ncbi:small ribosomal subunit protein mS78 (rPPR3a)-like [Tasmannia lanceolata]|uniref:small ribosomal subunit protein mS78 (rPPR3a)-like n=1 Tax=Tasmannia lanceolata TaxID=3420 RepID=UPI0040630DF5
MSSFSRLLRKNPISLLLSRGCSSSPSVKPNPPSSSSRTGLWTPILREKNFQNLVKKFKDSSENDRFRANRRLYDVAFRRLASAKQFSSIEEIIEHQKKYLDNSNEGFATRLIALYGKSGMFDHASKMFDELAGFKCPRTVKSFNALLTAALDSQNFEKVGELFHKLPSELSVDPNVVTYNILIQAFWKMGSLDSAFSVVELMEKNGISPDLVTFNTLLKGFYEENRFSEAEKVWAKMDEFNCSPDIISFNYKLQALVSEKKMVDAMELVQKLKSEGPKPDIFSYNVLIKCLCHDGNLEEAKRIYNELEENGCAPNRLTFETLIPCLSEKGDFDMAVKLSKESMTRRCVINVKVLQSVIDGLAKESRIAEAKEIVELGLSMILYRTPLKLPSGAE